MKVKTSVTRSQDLLQTIDQVVNEHQNRSLFLETAAWDYIAKLRRAHQNERDLEILNRRAEYLNAEAADALAYQIPL